MMMNVIMLMPMMKVMKVKGLVKVLLEVTVLVEVFVVEAEEVLLFSLSSTPTQTTNPRTRPAARVWASGVKGLGFQFALHPVDVVLDPFPETRPLAELGTASARGGQRDHFALLGSRVAISLHEISPASHPDPGRVEGRASAVERIPHIQECQGSILALA